MLKNILKKFDEMFVSPKTLWTQNINGVWYGKKEVRKFLQEEIEKVLKKVSESRFDVNNHKCRFNDNDYVCECYKEAFEDCYNFLK